MEADRLALGFGAALIFVGVMDFLRRRWRTRE
jgi:hypothetical protein